MNKKGKMYIDEHLIPQKRSMMGNDHPDNAVVSYPICNVEILSSIPG